MTNFHKKLKIGEQFENEYAYPLLIEQYQEYWIECTHDFKIGSYKGPKISKHGEKDLILPDFKLYNPHNSHRILVEAKFKSKPFSITGYPKTPFVAIERHKVEQYEKVAKIYSSDLKYIIGCHEKDTIHLCHEWVPHFFDNEFSTGAVCAFPLRDDTIISSF